jgi:hypothetical protein
MGNWGFKIEMEMINEAFWFQKIQIQSFISCSNDPYKFPTQMSNELHIWNHHQIENLSYYD